MKQRGPEPIAAVNSDGNDYSPFLDPPALTLYFDSDPDQNGGHDLYVATRPTLDAQFSAPSRIDELTTPDDETDPWVSPDGRYMVFCRNVGGIAELFEVYR